MNAAGSSPSVRGDETSWEEQLIYYGKKKQTLVSMQALVDTGVGALLHNDKLSQQENLSLKRERQDLIDKVIIQVACFLHRELPVRLAHRAVELEESALFMKSDNIKHVCSWYKTSFKQLRQCPAPINKEKEAVFAQAIESIYERHSATLITMVRSKLITSSLIIIVNII